jgi:hypothetical protein
MADSCGLCDGLDDGRIFHREAYRDEHRLLAVRAFLLQVRTFEGRTGVPQIQFCKRFKRRAPYIFSDQEIQGIMGAKALYGRE